MSQRDTQYPHIAEHSTTKEAQRTKEASAIEGYRHITGDNTSSDEEVLERLTYIEALVRNVIKSKLTKAYEQAKKDQ